MSRGNPGVAVPQEGVVFSGDILFTGRVALAGEAANRVNAFGTCLLMERESLRK